MIVILTIKYYNRILDTMLARSIENLVVSEPILSLTHEMEVIIEL
jgi:hypothetical protein